MSNIKAFRIEVVKKMIREGEIFAAQVACDDWRLSYKSIMKQVLIETPEKETK